MTHPLDSFFANAPAPVLLVAADDPVVAALPTGFTGSMLALSQVTPGTPAKGGWKSVLLVASDRASLRRAGSMLPRMGQCRTIGVWLTEGLDQVGLQPRPDWPALTSVHARKLTATGRDQQSDGVLTVARFAAPVGAHQVLWEFARQAVPWVHTSQGGVVVAYLDREPAPGLDVRARRLRSLAEAGDPEVDVPPDVVVVGPPTLDLIPAGAAGEQPATHHVIDRAPTVVSDPGLDPVDEQVYRPIGWRKDWSKPLVDLPTLAPGPAGVTEAVVERAREHLGVRVDLGADDPQQVLRLAMAGVPLLPRGHQPGFHRDLLAALALHGDLSDPLAREEHALRVRRATFDHHSTLAWRAGLARRAGTGRDLLPSVSVLLCTKRPQQVEFALGQVARQRGVDIELVLATHGFGADADRVRDLMGERPFQVLEQPGEAFFGDVLTAAAHAASAQQVLKIDDDDWYSPHAVHDLLMARRFSGADVVGMPSEFVRLEEPDTTVRRNHPSERYSRFVAGGTTLLDRTTLAELGDFRRVRRFVDTQLLTAVEAAGGRIYRTHGLGYVLRRTTGGHTWERDADEFRRAEIVDTEWPGFRPSAEMELD